MSEVVFNTSFTNDFSREVWETTYMYHTDAVVDSTFHRVAKDLASVEANPEEWENKFFKVLSNFAFVTGGRITSNAGTGLKGTTYLNCFVSGPGGVAQDSMEGILRELRHQGLILKSEGGYGVNADFMRPRGAFINGIGVESPGAVRMLDMWNTNSAVITAGSGQKKKNKEGKGKIRKGAMMVVMSCWHPSIEEFITAKQTKGVLDKFNMSVGITDAFMAAVEANQPWSLEFPDTKHGQYDLEWDGNLALWKSKGYSTIVYKTYANANELWDLLMKSTYSRNEPGVLFLDRINHLNNLAYMEHISATNPCLSGDTLVVTKEGSIPIKDLVGKTVEVYSNDQWVTVDNFRVTAENQPVLKVTLYDGSEVRCTPYHRFALEDGTVVLAENLVPGNRIKKSAVVHSGQIKAKGAYIKGFLIGDGYVQNGNPTLFVYEPKYCCQDRLFASANEVENTDINTNCKTEMGFSSYVGRRLLSGLSAKKELVAWCHDYKERLPTEIYQWDMQSKLDFIAGVMDADGTAQGSVEQNSTSSSFKYQITSIKKQWLQDFQMLLKTIDVNSRLDLSKKGGLKDFGKRGGICPVADLYRLNINQQASIKLAKMVSFSRLSSFANRSVGRFITDRYNTVVNVEQDGIEDKVYCCTVNLTHSFTLSNNISTMNCGEQCLPPMSACLLGSLNLTQFINSQMDDWDYGKLAEYLPIVVRLLDNVNDKSKLPLPEQEVEVRAKRRIGIGYLGYASALCMMNVKYGSEQALVLTSKLGDFVANTAYKASALLAAEKGPFPYYDQDKYLESNFIKMALNQSTIDCIKANGIRNSHLLSIQPTGNSSVFANNVSGGLEPMFSTEYIRTSIVSTPPFELPLVDWQAKSFAASNMDWKWVKEGDENLLATNYNGTVYKIDQSRGLVKETLIEDYAVHVLKNLNKWNPQAESATTAYGLTLFDHIETMKVFSKYVDAAMSKTINLPNTFSYTDFKNVYMNLYKTGTVKGATTYRDGTMSSVLSTTSTVIASGDDKIQKNNAPKRPKKMPCDLYHVSSGGEKYLVIVGLLDKDPYEVWAIPNGTDGEEKTGIVTDKQAYLLKVKSGRYDLVLSDRTVEDITSMYRNVEQQALSRMISTSLRHGADIKFVVTQLQKTEGSILCFSKCIARTLKRYILDTTGLKCSECGSKNFVMTEGCNKCQDCGYSGCK